MYSLVSSLNQFNNTKSPYNYIYLKILHHCTICVQFGFGSRSWLKRRKWFFVVIVDHNYRYTNNTIAIVEMEAQTKINKGCI